MSAKWFAAIILLTSLFGSSQLQAQSLKAQQQQLLRDQQSLAELQNLQQQLQTRLSDSKATLPPPLTKDSPEQSRLDSAQNNLDQARVTYSNNATVENRSRLKNFEFQYALAERKFNKANNRRLKQQQQIKQLSGQIVQNSESITELKNRINQLNIAINKTRTELQSRKQQQREQELRLQAQADAAEIARLRAQIEAHRQAEQVRTDAANASAATPALPATAANRSATSTAPARQIVASQPTAAAPVSSRARAGEISIKAGSPRYQPLNNDPGSSTVFLHTRELVAAEQQRLNQLLAQPEQKKISRYNKTLNVKPIAANGGTGPAEANTLRSLGHHYYRGNVTLPGGDAIFVVGFNRWRIRLPTSEQAQEYTVIFDGSDRKNPRLIYYPTALEN